MTDQPPLYIRVSDSKAVFGISRSTIYEMASRGDVRIYKVGGSALLKVSEVSAMIEGKAKGGGKDDGTVHT